jgi:phosphohistidine phosphatase
MRRLLLLRHAKSDWSKPGQPDRNRALNARGRSAAPVVGAYLAQHGLPPDLALVSTAERTRETWALLAPHLPHVPKVVFEDRLYNAGPDAILDVVRDAPRGVSALLVVGHNPGLHQLAVGLTASGDVDARARLGEKFPTATLAVIGFAGEDWGSVHMRGGRLERFVTPAALVAEPD